MPLAEEPAEPGVATVRIVTERLELLAADGNTVRTLPYAQPAAAALEALTGLLGGGTSELTAGNNICTEDTTVTVWAGLRDMHPGADANVPDWWVHFAAEHGAAGAVPVDRPDGVTAGRPVDTVRAEHPLAPTRSLSHQGTAHDNVYLDVRTRNSEWAAYDVAAEVGALDMIVSSLTAPVAVEGAR